MGKIQIGAAFYLRAFVASIAALFAVPCAHGAVAVTVDFVPSVISFSPGSAEYLFQVGVNASGFTDDSNPANFIKLASNDDAFSGDRYPATNTFSGTAGSNGYLTIAELNTAINSTGGFTLSITDGVTSVTSQYSLSVSTAGIDPDFVRPIDLNPGPNTTISSLPTFTISQSTTSNPAAQSTSGFTYLDGDNTGNYATTDPGLNGTSFTPIDALAPDTYTVGIVRNIDYIDPSILTVGTPTPLDGAPDLDSFDYSVSAVSNSQSGGLLVVPEPSGLIFFAAVGLLTLRRRATMKQES